MPGRSTIHQVAERMQVSASTVSRAFNKPHVLKPETVAAVVATAEEMGYVPNLHARALVTGRTGLVGLVVPDITNPFFPRLVRAAQRAAEAHQLSVLLVETNSVPDRERRHIASLAPHCEGLIVASPRLTAEELRQLAQSTRLVLINSDTTGVARVLISSADALAQGVELLAQEGCRHVTYVGGPHRSWSEQERSSTVAATCRRLGLSMTTLRDESGGYDEARQMVRAFTETTDAVVAFDDVIACGVLDGLSDRGIRVPQDVRLLGCDDALPIETRPRVSTIRLPTAQATVEAVKLLATAENGPTIPEARVVMHGHLRVRET